MKRFLQFCFFFLISVAFTTADAQTVLYSQSFDAGLGDMTSIDNDGLTVNANLNLPSEWSVIPLNNGDMVAASPSWFASPAAADDWLITPAITLESGCVMEWNAAALNGQFPDGYNVLISTTDMELSSFEALLSISAEEAFFNDRLLDLSAYDGQTVHLAFQNNTNDGVALALDDIVVRTTVAVDARIPGIELSNTNFVGAGLNVVTGLAGERNVIFDVFNAGSDPITTLEVTFTLDGVQYVETRDVNVDLGESYSFTSENTHDYQIGNNQGYSIDMVVVNGEDQNISEVSAVSILPPVPAYEAVDSKGEVVNVHELLDSGKTVILDFFASWCGPCATSTPMLNDWYVANGSGEGDMEVLGIDIEETDTDAIVNGLGWGATYPKISFKPQNELYWVHFTQNHELNEGFIPFFLMLCPNPGDASDSELNVNLIGVPQSGSFEFWQPSHDDCIRRFVDVEDVESLESIAVFPNPTSDNVNVGLKFGEVTDFRLSVTTIEGKLVKDLGNFNTSDLNMNVDVTDLVSGVFILQVTTPQGQRNHKFVKM